MYLLVNVAQRLFICNCLLTYMCYFIYMHFIFNDECLQTRNSWNNSLLKTLKMLVTRELQPKLEIKFKLGCI